MDSAHLRQHLADLRGRVHFLRTLRPESERYKLWLGDMIELTHITEGVDSARMTALRAVLTSQPRLDSDAPEQAQTEAYLARLGDFDAFLAEWESSLTDT